MSVQKFAPGWNNSAALKPFYLLNPFLFRDYTREIKQTWKGIEGKRLNGARLDKTWGKPSVILTFGLLSPAEYAYLLTLVGKCTLYVRNEDTNAFTTYVKANLCRPTFGRKSGRNYEDVAAEFIELTA